MSSNKENGEKMNNHALYAEDNQNMEAYNMKNLCHDLLYGLIVRECFSYVKKEGLIKLR